MKRSFMKGNGGEVRLVNREPACPACRARNLDLRTYDSMMVLHADLALFTLRCPSCSTVFSTLQPIPASLRDEVDFAAIEVGAKMGRD